MPQYCYSCKSCGNEELKRSTIAERKAPLEDECPECGSKDRFIALGVVQTVGGVSITDKRPEGWKDVLKKVHKSAGKTSTVNT